MSETIWFSFQELSDKYPEDLDIQKYFDDIVDYISSSDKFYNYSWIEINLWEWQNLYLSFYEESWKEIIGFSSDRYWFNEFTIENWKLIYYTDYPNRKVSHDIDETYTNFKLLETFITMHKRQRLLEQVREHEERKTKIQQDWGMWEIVSWGTKLI